MRIKTTKKFDKNYRKRISSNRNLEVKFEERVRLFQDNPRDPVLKNHKLTGSRKNLSAFSVAGDVRVLYEIRGEVAIFVDIGSHNQVY